MHATEHDIQRFWTDQPMIHPGFGFNRNSASPEEIFAHVERIMRDRGSLMQAPDAPLLSNFIDYSALQGRRVLEIGYGVGWLLNEFVKARAEVHGIDLSESHHRFSSYRFRDDPAVRLQVASAERIPYPDNYFDFVASFGVLHHAEDDLRCYAELRRVLKPGAKAFLMLYRRGGPKYWWWKIVAQGLLRGGLIRYRFNLDNFVYSVTDAYEGEGAPVSRHYTRQDLLYCFRKFSRAEFNICGNRNEWDNLPAHRLPLSNLLPRGARDWLVGKSGAYWMVDLTK
jgi:SAM-dependent methyltransferase